MTSPTTGWRDLLAEGRLPRFILIGLGVWLNAADSLVVATIMPSVGADLGGVEWFGWAVAGFMIGGILAAASAGRLSEIFGLSSATTAAGAVFLVGCVLSAAAPNMAVFLAGRLLQGMGSGWISGFAMVAIAELFPARHLPRVFASVAAVWGIATVVGPLVGGIFAEAGNWRAVFWMFAGQAVLFTAAAPLLLAGLARPAASPGVPWLQLAVLALGIAAIGTADLGGSALTAILLVAAGLAAMAALPALDRIAQVRLLPHRAGDLATVCGSGYLALFALTAASMALTVYGPAILQTLHGLTPLTAGYAVGMEALAWTLTAFVVTGVTVAAERRWIRLGAAGILAGVAILTAATVIGGVTVMVVGAAVMGAGFGFSNSLINRRILAALAPEDRAIGSSALIAVRQAGSAVGAAIAGVAANLLGFAHGLTAAVAADAAPWIFATGLPLAAVGGWAAVRLVALPDPSEMAGAAVDT